MRSVIEFYRRRPLVLVVAIVLGVAIAVATTSLGKDESVLLPIVFVAVAGIVVGSVIGALGRGRGG